jgi:alkylhydroperoxidase/carboxymuconolactone decarboxylase family protein YurZ
MSGKSNNNTPWYVLNAPEIGGAFQKAEDIIQEKGVVEDKTNTLLQLAIAVIFRNAPMAEEHIQQAIAMGASREEITEVFLITATQCAKTQLSWAEGISRQYLRHAE